jgi:hypothetical protein
MRALIVLTSRDRLAGPERKTGIQLKSFAAGYYSFLDSGFDVAIATPLGGHTPIDPVDFEWRRGDAFAERFCTDQSAREDLSDALALSQICPVDFAVAYYADGVGALGDLVDDTTSHALLLYMHRNGRPSGFVGYGVAGLFKARDDSGVPLLKGRRTATPMEEDDRASGLPEGVLSLARGIASLGALVVPGARNSSHVVEDGPWITGRDITASEEVARCLIAAVTAP